MRNLHVANVEDDEGSGRGGSKRPHERKGVRRRLLQPVCAGMVRGPNTHIAEQQQVHCSVTGCTDGACKRAAALRAGCADKIDGVVVDLKSSEVGKQN